MLYLFKEKKLVFYLNPKFNAYSLQAKNLNSEARTKQTPVFFNKHFNFHFLFVLSLNFLGMALYSYIYNLQNCKLSSFYDFPHLFSNNCISLFSYKDSETQNAVLPFLKLSKVNRAYLPLSFQHFPIPKTKEDSAYKLAKKTIKNLL